LLISFYGGAPFSLTFLSFSFFFFSSGLAPAPLATSSLASSLSFSSCANLSLFFGPNS